MAISSFFSALRTGMVLNSKVAVPNSMREFWMDQLTGISAGVLTYALLADWFASHQKPLTQLVVIAVAALSSTELLAITKSGFLAFVRKKMRDFLGGGNE